MSRRREMLVCIAAAAVLVLLRSVMPTVYEGFYFDSDQAIVGLMAKRAAAFEEFPLFYSGLNYILGVEAWIIAPLLWIARPSVAVMRAPLVALNVAVAIAMVTTFSRRLGLRPALALVAALPFIIPTPAAGYSLLEAAGACVEPFVYVLLLWRLRSRPLAFGALLAVGYLHREFVIFCLPALMLTERAWRAIWTRTTMVHLSRAAAGFALVYLIVDDLKMHLTGATVALQAVSLRGNMCLAEGWLLRVRALLGDAYPTLLGGAPVTLQHIRMNTPLVTGHKAVGWLLAATFSIMLVRLALMRAQRDPSPSTPASGLPAYLAWIGLFSAAVYPLSCAVAFGAPPILRYMLLGLLLPVGIAALYFQRERSVRLRTAAVAVVVVWSAVNLIDHARVLREAAVHPPLNEHRVLADFLVAQRIRYARAAYWDAYVVDFLSRERVTVTSWDVMRIEDYQRQVDEHAGEAWLLERLPCEGGMRIASWCVKR